MDPAARKRLKEQLLRDVHAWDGVDKRGFRDIVRNAADVDAKYLAALMKEFGAKFADVRGWGSGAIVPDDFNRYAIVEKIRELLEKDTD